MFTQLSGSLEKVHGGLGIGLSLAKSLVEMHGGAITVHSEGLGTGCEFTVTLPLSTELAETPPTEAPAPAAASNAIRILVVDDNVDAADSLATLLEICGHRCRMVHDAKSALEAFADFRPELILSDIGLPEINGYELARRLRRLDGGATVRLIAVSGWGQPDDIKRAEEAGFDQHLTKPVDPDVLLKIIAEWIEAR
jgi:CheY-like chemotaxis protein